MLCFLMLLLASDEHLSPAESIAKIRLPDGLVAELVASEPAIESPVAISFDERGRMYVAEYRDYPNGPPKNEKPLSRIRLLEDTDGDGHFEKSTVFADTLSFAQGLLCWNGGVLVTAAPFVFFLKDEDGNGKADRKEIFFEGFKEGNPQLRVSHPRWGLDNRIYMSNGLSGGEVRRSGSNAKPIPLGQNDICFDPQTLELYAASGYGQFGNTFDDWGRRFVCSNRNPVIHSFIPWESLRRNPYAILGSGYADVAPAGGATRVYPLISTSTTAESHAGTHTAACGVWVYRGDLLGGDFVDNIFVCDPTAFLVTRSRLVPSGVGFKTERDRPGEDFLCSTDSWFRPVSIADGPDGALYIVDMHREVIEHPQYMPKGLPEKLRLRAGADKGRIIRVRPKHSKSRPFIPPRSTADCVALLDDPNGWRRDLGQRLLVERKPKDAAKALRKSLHSPRSQTRVQAMWTLKGLGQLDGTALKLLLNDSDPRVLENALFASQSHLGDTSLNQMIQKMLEQPSARVRFAAALMLAGIDDPSAVRAVFIEPFDPWIGRAVLSSQRVCNSVFPKALDQWPTFDSAKAEFLTAAASAIGAEGNRNALRSLFIELADRNIPFWSRSAVFTGLAEGLPRGKGIDNIHQISQLISKPPQDLAAAVKGIAGFREQSSSIAIDRTMPTPDRLAAMKLLRHLPNQIDVLQMVGSNEPSEIQKVAIEIESNKRSNKLADHLIAVWSSLSPSVQDSAVDFFFRSSKMQVRLLEAMQAGKVPASCVGPERRDMIINFNGNKEIVALARKVFGATNGNREEVISKYKSAMKTTSDAERGKEVFKRVCANCHRLEGIGVVVGPELADIRQKTVDTLLSDILDPNRAVEPRFSSYVAVLDDGRTIAGLLAEQSTEHVTLVLAENKKETIGRRQIESLTATGKSLMPDGVEKDISPEQMADLIAYLKKPK